MSYTQRVPVRFDDVDFAQIVYFPRLFGYCHWAFEDFFGREAQVTYAQLLGKRRVGFPTVNAKADFRAPLRFGDVCRVEMEVLKLGNSSLTTRHRLFLGESSSLCAQIELVHVATDLDKMKSVEIPKDIRAALERHLAA
jgi:4-hydroxybenzoyl-CoA thioesterase